MYSMPIGMCSCPPEDRNASIKFRCLTSNNGTCRDGLIVTAERLWHRCSSQAKVSMRSVLRCHLSYSSRYTLAMKKNIWRAVIEVGFIVFLFYSNLLMGEFERSGMGRTKGIAWAIRDIFTMANFEIAMVAALIGYLLFEFLRKLF